MQLQDFISRDSWFFFQSLKISTEFLVIPASEWDSLLEYQSAKAKVQSIKVVNDSAERGVKLASDFLHTARDESRFQKMLQIVEKSRNEKPDQRKV